MTKDTTPICSDCGKNHAGATGCFTKHCGYCSEGYDGKCDGVYCDPCACSEWVIKRLEDQNAKLLADWRRMKDALIVVKNGGLHEGKNEVRNALSSISYQDSPTQ